MKLTIPNLLPGTKYAIQVRAVDGAKYSEWSPIFRAIIGQDLQDPKAPTNFTWEAIDDSFHAGFDTVTENVDGSEATIIKYEFEFRVGSNTQLFGIVGLEGDRQQYDLTYERASSWFGKHFEGIEARVRAVNVARNKSAWTAWKMAGLAAPDAPTDAVVTSLPLAIGLSWTPPVNTNNLYGYRVYASEDGVTFGPNGLVYEGISPEYIYVTSHMDITYFEIRSYSKAGQESPPLLAQGVPKPLMDGEPPAVPAGLAGTLINSADGLTASGHATWTMDNPPDDMFGFVLRYRDVGAPAWQQVFTDKDAREATFPAVPYKNYEIQIASMDENRNTSEFSPIVVLTAATNTPPAAPIGLDGVPALDSIRYSWTEAPEGDVAGQVGHYELQVASNSGFTTGVATYPTGYPTVTATGLSPNHTYYARVRAIDSAGGIGEWSTVISDNTQSFPDFAATDGDPPDSSPTPTSAPGVGYLYLRWSAIENNDIVTYEVHTSTTDGFTPSPSTLNTEVTATSTILQRNANGSLLSYGTDYYVRIVAKDLDGPAPAGTQIGPVGIRQAVDGDIEGISVEKLESGQISSAQFIITDDGSLSSADGNIVITEQGVYVGPGSEVVADAISSGTITVGTDITVNGNLTMNGATAWIQSAAFSQSGGGSGYRLTNAGLYMYDGEINVRTLRTGTIGEDAQAAITIGGNSYIDVASGFIRGGGYTGTDQSTNPSNTGWYIGSDGLNIRDGKIRINAIEGGTYSGTTISLSGPTAAITGTGWALSSAGLSITSAGGGSGISGNVITTGLITSTTYVPGSSGWRINLTGGAEFNTITVRSGTLIGGTMQSTSYSQVFRQGWKIDNAGTMDLTEVTAWNSVEAVGSSGSKAVITTPGSSKNPAYNDPNSQQWPQLQLWHPNYIYPAMITMGGSGNYMQLMPARNSTVAPTFIKIGTDSVTIQGAPLRIYGGVVLDSDMDLNNHVINGVDNINAPENTMNLSVNTRLGTFNGVIIRGTSNVDAVIETKSGSGGGGLTQGSGIALQDNYVAAVRKGMNAVNPAASNTMPFLCNGMESFGTVRGVGAYQSNSDQRDKTNIQDVDPGFATEAVKNLKIKSFEMTVGDEDNQGRTQYGVIAQEAKEVLPSAVSWNERRERYGAYYNDMFALNLAATQRLLERVDELEAQVASLTNA